jgi:hypothetical protein
MRCALAWVNLCGFPGSTCRESSQFAPKPVPVARTLLPSSADWRIFGARGVYCQPERHMKGLEKKKEAKKKPAKTLKEKRAEKHAKRDAKD